MLRAVLPTRPEVRWVLFGTLVSSVGRGLTLPFLFIYLTEVRGLASGTVGLVVAWMGVISLTLAPVGGTLIDRFGARRVMLPCLASATAGASGLAVASTTWQAVAAVTGIALGFAGLYATQMTILASLSPERERQRVFGLQFAMVNLGIGIGGVISGAVVDVTRPGTFQLIYLLDAGTYLVPAAILLALPAVGQRLVDRPATAAVAVRGGYLQVLRHRAFRRFMIFALVLTSCGYAQIEVGFAAFATVLAEVSPRVVGWALAANSFTIVLAQLFVLRALEGRSRTRTLAAVGTVFATAWLVLGGAGLVGMVNAALASIGVIACAWIFAIGETLLSPVMPALTNALASDELRGRYNAMGSMIWGVSGIIGPVTAGPLIGAGHGGLWVTLVVSGCLVASLLALWLHRMLTPVQDGRLQPAHQPQPAATLTSV